MESDQPLDAQLFASELAAHLVGGEALDAGDVTVDQERALAKLHLYSRPEPQAYVLELVRAASARGATTVEFAVDREDVRIFFDGTHFTEADLEQIHAAALMPDHPKPGLHALARGLSAACALNPQVIRLLSGDEQSRYYLEMPPTGLAEVAEVHAGKPGTLIQVRQRYRDGLRTQFAPDQQGIPAEVAFLRKYCAHAQIPVFVNGERISDPAPPASLVGVVELEGDTTRGFAGFDPSRGKRAPFAHAEFQSGGVLLSGHDLPHFPPWFFARVDDLQLRSEQVSDEVLRGEHYQRVIAELHRASDRSLVMLASELVAKLHDDPDAAIPEWQFDLLRSSLFLRVGDDPAQQLTDDPVFTALANIDLWEVADGSFCSTQALIGRPMRFSHRPDDGQVPEGFADVVFIEDDADAHFLSLLGGEDATRAVLRTREYEQNRRKFEQRRHAPRLADSYYLGRIPLTGEGLRGEVGLRGLGSQRCVCRLLVSGCLLRQQALEFPLPGLDVTIEADFKPNNSFTGVHRNETLAYAIFEMLCGVERLMAAVARAWPVDDLSKTRDLFLPYIRSVAAPEFGAQRLQEFGFSPSSASRYIRKFGGPAYCPQWNLESETPHPLASVPLFAVWDAPAASLLELRRRFKARGALPYLPYNFQTVANLPAGVLRLHPEDIATLEAILGADTLYNYEPELSRLGLRATFMERPQRALELSKRISPRVACEVDGIEVVAGLDQSRLLPERLTVTHSSFEVLKYRRKLGHHGQQVLLPGVVGLLNDDATRVNELWNDLPDDFTDDELDRLNRAVQAGLCALLDEVATLCREQPITSLAELRRFVLLALAAVFDHPTMFTSYQGLLAQDPDGAEHTFRQLLELLATHSKQRVLAAIREVQTGSTPLTFEAVLQAAGRKRRLSRKSARAHQEAAATRIALLSRVPALMEVPVARTTSGKPLTMQDLVRMYQQLGVVHYLGTEVALHYDGFERTIVVLGGSECLALSRLLGWDALACSEAWLRQKIARQEGQGSESRRPALPVGERLIAIEVIDDGFEGQLGLRRWGPLRGEPTQLRLYRNRVAGAIYAPKTDFTVVGVLDHPQLEVDGDGQPTPAWAKRIEAVLAATQSELVGRLIARWDDFNSHEVAVACRWVMHLLAQRAPGAGEGGAAINRACDDPIVARLINQPAWMTTRGVRASLAELADAYAQHGAMHYLTRAWVHEPPKVPVVVIEPDQQSWLEALFPEVVDHMVHWTREVLSLRRRSQAERLPALPPTDALEAVRVDTRGLRGWLWVLPETNADTTIRLGLDGLEVERRQLSPLFACDGSVMGTGDDLQTDESWGRVHLGRGQESALIGCSVQLYRELIDTHERALEQGGGRVRLKGRARRGLEPEVDTLAITRQLCELTLRLHHRFVEREGRLKSSYRRLLRRLRVRELFELRSHRFVSLETLLTERPAEFAHLGLWRTETASGPVLSVDVEVTRTVAEEPQLRELPPPTPEHRLLEAVRSELRLVNAAPDDLQAETYFDRLSIGPIEHTKKLVIERGGYIVINLKHPVADMALRAFETDPLSVSALASCVYTDFAARTRQPALRSSVFVSKHAKHARQARPAEASDAAT